MATPMSADTFIRVLKKEGVNVKEHSGWRSHNRNHVKSWGPVNGVVIHHTAGSSSLSLCYNGSAALPGPLCHTHLSKNGVATMVGNGRANHAGTFASNAFNAMLNESKTHPRPSASEPIDANSRTYGIEIENLGNGRDPYPSVQYDAAVRWAAAICRHHGWSEHSVIGHKEGTTRKIDPSFDMNQFRRDVAARLAGSGTAPTIPEDEDMPIRTSLGKTKSQYLPWDDFRVIKWNVEHADPLGQHAKGNFPGFIPKHSSWSDHKAKLQITGTDPSDWIQVRFEAHDWKSGKSTGKPWTEIVYDESASTGDSHVVAVTSKHADKSQHVYVAVKVIAGPGRETAAKPKAVVGRWTISQDK